MKNNVGEAISTWLSPSSEAINKGVFGAVTAVFLDHLSTAIGLSLPPKNGWILAELNPYVAENLVRWHGLDLLMCLLLIGVGVILGRSSHVWSKRILFTLCLVNILAHGIAFLNNFGWLIWYFYH